MKPTHITIDLTVAEYRSLPLVLRNRISRRWIQRAMATTEPLPGQRRRPARKVRTAE